MAKVSVKSVGAIIDGRPLGSTFELDERTAERLAAQGYVEIIGKVTEPKAEPKPKKDEASAPKPKAASKPKATPKKAQKSDK